MLSSSLLPLVRLIETQTGLNLKAQDQKMLQSFINQRLQHLGFADIPSYCDHVTTQSPETEEWQSLIDQVTTGESYFWRDPGQLQVIAEHLLPEIIQAKRAIGELSLRIWSAGCSTGEEAYTLAILLQNLLPDWHKWQILLVGTDLNPVAVAKAKAGIYKPWSFRQTPFDFRSRYFHPVTEGWQVIDKIRAMPTFTCGNLVQSTFPVANTQIFEMDLILCRNVFIYFPAKVIAGILQKFYATLQPKGYLICGHVELQGQDLSAFQVISFPDSMVYQRRALHPASPTQVPIFVAGPKGFEHAVSPVQVLRTQKEHPPLLAPTPLTAKQSVPHYSLSPNEDAQRSWTTSQAAAPTPTKVELQSHLLQAQIYADQGKYSQAKTCCQATLEEDPEALPPLYLLAQIAEVSGEIKQAKALLKKIIYLSPDAAAAYLELGELYRKERQLDQAQKLFRTAQSILLTMPPNMELTYRGRVTVKALLQYLESQIASPSS